jgi:Zn-dependent protease
MFPDDEPLVTRQRLSIFGLGGSATALPPTVSGASNEDVLAALRDGASQDALALIDELKNPPAKSWASQIGVLAVTLLLFVGAGLLDWSVRELVLVVVVLLVHETGHLVAMKALGYRDVRMFFIPFFGAAVSGAATRASGARRTLVALAGPVPGILLGLFLAFGYAVTYSPVAGEAAKMFLLLNVFNLLPLLPLDGGHVLLETVFIRNRWFEAAFQVAAAAGLVLLAFASRSPLLGILGVLMLKGAPQAVKIGRLAAEIRATADGPMPSSIPEAPLPFLVRIVEGVDTNLGGGANPRDRATLVRTVFERLHPNPPRAWATIGLLAAYAAAFAAAVMGGVFIAIAQAPPGA